MNWTHADQDWPSSSENPLILVAAPGFNSEGKFTSYSYHVVKFDRVDEFEGDIWTDCLLDEPFDMKNELGYWMPLNPAPEWQQMPA